MCDLHSQIGLPGPTVHLAGVQPLESGSLTLAMLSSSSPISDPGSARLAKELQTLQRGRAESLDTARTSARATTLRMCCFFGGVLESIGLAAGGLKRQPRSQETRIRFNMRRAQSGRDPAYTDVFGALPNNPKPHSGAGSSSATFNSILPPAI
jgi:hypothetical protein